MDESREITVEAAVREALAAQAEDPDSGYGVAFQVGEADYFVQWVRDLGAPASLEVIEVKSEGAEPPAALLTSRGFTPHSSSDLAEIGIWEVLDPEILTWADEEQLVAVLADLVRLLGGRDGQSFEVYP